MPIKIAAFNVENLFDRPKAFNTGGETADKTIGGVAELNSIFEKTNYTEARKRRILELVEELELNRFNEGPFSLIRIIRGHVLKRPRSGGIEVVANGRDDWIGWTELKTAPVNEIAIENTGRVIRDVDADIMAVIEAENRVVLEKFVNLIVERVVEELPSRQRPAPYENFMLVDGNDDRGIDVGLITKPGFSIGDMRSHLNDHDDNGRVIFSRDCPEYAVRTPDDELIWVLPNHFKSKFGGNQARSNAKRKSQAKRTAEIYRELLEKGQKMVVVLGDLNDTPDSDPLKPLLRDTDLKDVSEHENFYPGEFSEIGTFGLGNDNQKIDFLLLSPELFSRVSSAGLFRKGAWPGSRPPRWTVYEQLRREMHVASDHHVIWAEID